VGSGQAGSVAVQRALSSKVSLQKLDSGLLPEVFGTRESALETTVVGGGGGGGSFGQHAGLGQPNLGQPPGSEHSSPVRASGAGQGMSAAQVCVTQRMTDRSLDIVSDVCFGGEVS
jgi:hypothetical protein